MKYFLFVFFILSSCQTNYKIPSKKFDDQIISTEKNSDGTKTYKFYRHGLEYVDIAQKGKLIERKVFEEGKIIYKYPILKSNIGSTKIFLKSGNDFLSKNDMDTLVFTNDNLPIMNRYFWGQGIMFNRLDENTYLVKPGKDNNGLSKFYISAGHNYEEIQNQNGFIVDSLILPIR